MQQELSRRLVWILAGDMLAEQITRIAKKEEIDSQRFDDAQGLRAAIADETPAAVVVDTRAIDDLSALVEACRRRPDAPAVLALTDEVSPAARRRLYDAGVDDYLPTPLVAREVLGRLGAAMGAAGRRPGGAGSGPPPAPVARVRKLAERAPLSVLVADAEPMVQRVLRATFERRGWFVSQAADGREALQLAGEHGFDLVVMELSLPFKNGFELLDELGGAASAHRPRMVVASAETQQDSVLRAFELGADDFVSKPVDPEVLVARIERLIDG